MLWHKSKRVTTYQQFINALSALDIFTMKTFQHQWALCAINSINSCLMLFNAMHVSRSGRGQWWSIHCLIPSTSLYFKRLGVFIYRWCSLHEHWWRWHHHKKYFFQPQQDTESSHWFMGLRKRLLQCSSTHRAAFLATASCYIYYFSACPYHNHQDCYR